MLYLFAATLTNIKHIWVTSYPDDTLLHVALSTNRHCPLDFCWWTRPIQLNKDLLLIQGGKGYDNQNDLESNKDHKYHKLQTLAKYN